jgi:biotin carboxyl carrier protein
LATWLDRAGAICRQRRDWLVVSVRQAEMTDIAPGPFGIELGMPKLGMAMTEGVFVQWLADDGEQVREGQPIYVVGTDKVDSEIPAPSAGVLRHIAVEDQTYPVGAQLGWIDPPAWSQG